MTRAVYQINVLRNTNTIYAITENATPLHIKPATTEQLGTFSFTVPGKEGLTRVYDDLQPHDLVKIWLNYDSVDTSADPLFTGRVQTVESFTTNNGLFRRVNGQDEGEIAKRLLKINRRYSGSADTESRAYDIAENLASELGVSYSADADTNYVTQTVNTQPYLDVLKIVSDMWIDAGNQLKKDLYFKNVSGSNTLCYKNRPVRTAGVSEITEGVNLKSYRVIRDVMPVKNRIYVFGKQEQRLPASSGKDVDDWAEPNAGWTESLDNWTTDQTLTLETTYSRCNSHHLKLEYPSPPAGEFSMYMQRTFSAFRVKDNARLYFSMAYSANPVTVLHILLLAPDTSNYFRYYDVNPTLGVGPANWTQWIMDIGPACEVASGISDGVGWNRYAGNPDWYNIQGIRFKFYFATQVQTLMYLDCLHFEDLRWSYMTEDATSQTAYGRRDYEYVADSLHSDAECEARAKTLLYQLKDLPIQIQCTVTGDPNILVGDRIPVTLTDENISAQNYDVLTVDHNVSETDWTTTATMMNSANVRKQMLGTNQTALLKEMWNRIATLNKNVVFQT